MSDQTQLFTPPTPERDVHWCLLTRQIEQRPQSRCIGCKACGWTPEDPS